MKPYKEVLMTSWVFTTRAPLPANRSRQWEDNLVNGRPDWDKVGAQFVADVVPFGNDEAAYAER